MTNKSRHFCDHSLSHQEVIISGSRAKLKSEVRKQKDFLKANEFIDRKIQYDQRFFNDGYAEFQIIISDIRK